VSKFMANRFCFATTRSASSGSRITRAHVGGVGLNSAEQAQLFGAGQNLSGKRAVFERIIGHGRHPLQERVRPVGRIADLRQFRGVARSRYPPDRPARVPSFGPGAPLTTIRSPPKTPVWSM